MLGPGDDTRALGEGLSALTGLAGSVLVFVLVVLLVVAGLVHLTGGC